MKKQKLLYYILMFLPFVMVTVFLPFLPEQIPAHYGFNGQVTRWGSKYETFIFPVITLLMGIFLLAMAKISSRQKDSSKNNEQITLTVGMVCLVIFNLCTIYFLYIAFHKVENLSFVPANLTRLFWGILSVFMVLVGIIMPKLKMNSVIGFRTKWSMKNAISWEKCQRFSGISFIISGILILLICVAVPKIMSLVLLLAILLIQLFISICYSYYAAKHN